MDFLYKTLRLPSKPSVQYQRKGGKWYKREAGETSWILGNANVQKVLSNEFKGKNALFFYSNTAKIGAVLLLIGGATFFFRYKNKK